MLPSFLTPIKAISNNTTNRFLFIAALVIFVINLKKQRSSGSPPDAVPNESKLKAQMQPMNPQTYEQVPQQ